MTGDQLLRAYRTMVLIRAFEQQAATSYAAGEIPGFVHLSIGQEAVAVGACMNLRPTDVITSTHRGHGHAIAKGLDVHGMFAELMGKRSGTCHGRGGSMHIADPQLGIFGANGIVAAGLPIAVGAAFAARAKEQGDVVVAFFGVERRFIRDVRRELLDYIKVVEFYLIGLDQRLKVRASDSFRNFCGLNPESTLGSAGTEKDALPSTGLRGHNVLVLKVLV